MNRYKLSELMSRLYFPKKKLTGKIWDMRKPMGWGRNFQWFNTEKFKVVGWTTPRAKIGDQVLAPMKSGKVMRFAIVDIEYPGHVDDMWFAYLEKLGYVGEPLRNHKYKE